MKTPLGSTVRDIITGFTGVVTGRVEYITGCNQLLVAPPAENGPFRSAEWIDESRVEIRQDQPVITLPKVTAEAPGCDRQAPKR